MNKDIFIILGPSVLVQKKNILTRGQVEASLVLCQLYNCELVGYFNKIAPSLGRCPVFTTISFVRCKALDGFRKLQQLSAGANNYANEAVIPAEGCGRFVHKREKYGNLKIQRISNLLISEYFSPNLYMQMKFLKIAD